MRAGLSLVVLLVTLGIVALLWKQYTLPAVSAGRKGQIEAAQIAGQDGDGMKAKDSMTLEPQESGNELRGILVTSVVAGGPMAKYFDLQKDDVIVEVGPQRVRDIPGGFGMAEALVQEAYQRESPLVVMRNGQEVHLPDSTAAPTPLSKRTGFGALPAAPSSTPPTGNSAGGGNSLQNQLNAIQGQGQAVPTH